MPPTGMLALLGFASSQVRPSSQLLDQQRQPASNRISSRNQQVRDRTVILNAMSCPHRNRRAPLCVADVTIPVIAYVMQVFVKGLLDKLKVQPEVFRREEYKVHHTAHHTILRWTAYQARRHACILLALLVCLLCCNHCCRLPVMPVAAHT